MGMKNVPEHSAPGPVVQTISIRGKYEASSVTPTFRDNILHDIKAAEVSATSAFDVLQRAVCIMHERFGYYYWCGIYILVGDTLHLGPYVGPKTDHVRIKVGQGVCGTAVARNTNQVVEDVHKLSNYLACNLETRAEIVVLVRDADDERILGQIDVDSTQIGAFDVEEEAFLVRVAAVLAPYVREVQSSFMP